MRWDGLCVCARAAPTVYVLVYIQFSHKTNRRKASASCTTLNPIWNRNKWRERFRPRLSVLNYIFAFRRLAWTRAKWSENKNEWHQLKNEFRHSRSPHRTADGIQPMPFTCFDFRIPLMIDIENKSIRKLLFFFFFFPFTACRFASPFAIISFYCHLHLSRRFLSRWKIGPSKRNERNKRTKKCCQSMRPSVSARARSLARALSCSASNLSCESISFSADAISFIWCCVARTTNKSKQMRQHK